MDNNEVRTRNAPSPTGIPHIGNSRTALFDYLLAKKYNGKFILRIEDTDSKRFVPGAIEKIYEIHEKLGLVPDESPAIGGDYGPYIQTERLDLYQKYARDLVEADAAYYCFCTEERLTALHKDNPYAKYDRHCRHLSSEEVSAEIDRGTPHVIRAKMPETGFTAWTDLVQGKLSLPNAEQDDKVLLKQDGIPTYNLAVVVDDHLMSISHVLRGVEYISSTPVHLFLYQSLGWAPPIIAHVPLLLGPDKSKLSKRHGAKSALEYLADGYLPEAIDNFMLYLGFSYQDNSAILSLSEMIPIFDETKIQKQNAIFDITKLDHFNSRWIKRLSDSEVCSRLTPFLPPSWATQPEKILAILPLVKDRLYTLKDFEPSASFFFETPELVLSDLQSQSNQTPAEISDWLKSVIAAISPARFTALELHEDLKALQEQSTFDPRGAFMTIRYALTGRTVSPPIFDCMVCMGLEETIKRLSSALKILV